MDVIDYTDITTTQVLQHRCYCAWLQRRHQKMHMVAHEDICVHGASSAGSRFGEAFQIEPPIGVAKETSSAVVAALNYVLRYAEQL
jgi:hypothetical protein